MKIKHLLWDEAYLCKKNLVLNIYRKAKRLKFKGKAEINLSNSRDYIESILLTGINKKPEL